MEDNKLIVVCLLLPLHEEMIKAVHFTQPLTMEYLAKFKPPRHVLAEDTRLRNLAQVGIERWQVVRNSK